MLENDDQRIGVHSVAKKLDPEASCLVESQGMIVKWCPSIFPCSLPCVTGYCSNGGVLGHLSNGGMLGRLDDSDSCGNDVSFFGNSSSYFLLGSCRLSSGFYVCVLLYL
jgi:hypothetical protein